MARVLPEWQPFELETENPTPLELPGRRGPGVVLLASPSVHESGWGARAAARIAGLRAVRSQRILLGDLAVEDPHLHELLGVENDVGMSDVFLFGTSIQKTARKADEGFLFSPAGTAVADPGRILEHERWDDVLEGFERAEADLFVYVPWSSAGWQSLVATVGNVVVLAGRHEVAALDIPDGGEVRIGAVLGPPEGDGGDGGDGGNGGDGGDEPVVTAAAAPPMDVPEPRAPEEAGEVRAEDGVDETDEGEWSGGVDAPAAPATEGDRRESEGGPEEAPTDDAPYPAGPGAGAAAATKAPAEPRTEDDDWPREAPSDEPAPASSNGRLWVAIVVILVVIAAALAAAVGLLRGPDDASGSPDDSAPVSVAGGADEGAVPAEGPESAEGEGSATEGVTAAGTAADEGAAGALRPFVVRVAAYQEAGAADDARASLEARLDGAAVLRVPVDVDGVVWHRVVAGPASDAEAARALRSRAAGLLGVDTTSMLVRAAPLAFRLAVGPALGPMRQRAAALRADGIPAYVLESVGPEGATEFRVYAGAFESPADASHLRSVLANAGIMDAALVERTGRLPSA